MKSRINAGLFILTFLILAMNQEILATTIHVPGDYATIQAGIGAAINGDTVLVQPGTYVENINYNGKNIVVQGEDKETTIIDGNQLTSVVHFENGEDSTAVLDGFTITNGRGWDGGGITCQISSNPTLSNLIITGNSASYEGGGISCKNYSSPSLVNVTSTGNSAEYGGGIYSQYSSPSLVNVTISGNSADYGGGGIY